MTPIRCQTIAGLKPGDSFTVTRTFTEADMHTFAAVSKDDNPVHFDDRFALSKGFSGRICHGLLVGSLLTEVGGQIGWLASGMTFRFKKPVYFGDTVTCRFTIGDIDADRKTRADVLFTNQRREIVIEATISGILPNRAERALMAETVR